MCNKLKNKTLKENKTKVDEAKSSAKSINNNESINKRLMIRFMKFINSGTLLFG